ncbi:hypothetical protein E2562_033565 [Oryza meyeriana var. granulata]|uniref:Uncharacterized protein n=1 Tax=Oryza meyeriana var. granulata TaxID=110450 RepID=A0A6G1CV58_9ORYZ|nr:hypothetical protein E2562_033565 [Oryza meyeriana var. granulata]
MALLAAGPTVSSCTSGTYTSTTSTSTTSGGQARGSNKRNNRRNGGGGRNSGHQGNQNGGGYNQQTAANQAAPRPTRPWVCFNPWATQPQHWRSSTAGILGPFPQANIAFTGPFVSPPTANLPPPVVAQPNWDQAGLVAALNQLTVQSLNPWGLSLAMAALPTMGVERPRPHGCSLGRG